MDSIPKYPRTLHIGDSGGRSSRHQVEFDALAGRHLVVEEKIDGSHAGLFFDDEASLRVFSRSTILSEDTVHQSLRPLLQAADRCVDVLWDVLGTRYVLYGEWVYAMHAIFYDALPAYFIEDDVYDRERSCSWIQPSGARC
ncbi:MAG: RNA ligase family protein [Deltaproteobacteria bacterium]|nr:RNA ligase family protein [Deltaproteobacteria bacterium]